MSLVVITAADAKFFPWAQSTIRSIRDKPEGKRAPLALLDLGCTEEQRRWLDQQVDLIREPEWEYPFPPTAKIPGHFRGLFARPFLRRYFPGFEIYLWIDADAWVQDWGAVELYVRGARKRGLAIVPEFARPNTPLFGGFAGYVRELAKWYGSHYGPAIGDKMSGYPMLNAGVFALHKDTPHWEIWDDCLRAALKTSCSNLADQLALSLAVFDRGLLDKTEFLPPTCNWMCHNGLPAWSHASRRFVDPYLPHATIGILHLIHLTGELNPRAELQSVDGPNVTLPLRYKAN